MSDVDDVPEVAGVGGGLGIGLGPALIAGPAGELDQRGSAVGVGGQGTSGGAKKSVLAISCTRSGAVSATALTLARPQLDELGVAGQPGLPAQTRVRGQQGDVEVTGQCHVEGVVKREVVPQGPRPSSVRVGAGSQS